MKSEIENRAEFNIIRYAQCWEDADILIEALQIKPTDNILSIASAGDNSFAMLTKNPKHILAVDLSFEQIACCELRKACYKYLCYSSFIGFSGVWGQISMNKKDRIKIYNSIKDKLPKKVKAFWDEHLDYIELGFMTVGKFENYFKIFREKVLPLVHKKEKVDKLLAKKSISDQAIFYNTEWNTLRWKGMFKIFFSKKVMGKLGRDPEFYKYVKTAASKKILERAEYALTKLSTYENPYLHFILKGKYNKNLPCALREENFEIIKQNIDKIEFKQMSIEDAITSGDKFDCYNLSDIFEYMSQDAMDIIYRMILKSSNAKARVAYWNMLVDRKCSFKTKVTYKKDICKKLLLKDKAFFYQDFVLEEIQ